MESRLQENSVIEITPEKQPCPVAKKILEERPLIVPSDTRHTTPSVKYNPIPVIKDNGRTKSKGKSNKPTETDNSLVITTDSRTPEIGNSPSSKRKQILLVGTSIIRYLNAKLIAGRKSYIRKVTKYTVNEANTFIENYDLEFKPEVIVYQFGGNDIEGVNGFEFSDQIVELVSTTNLKFPGMKVMVSLGLTRRQRSANLKVIELTCTNI